LNSSNPLNDSRVSSMGMRDIYDKNGFVIYNI
jgi:hypothetical protein